MSRSKNRKIADLISGGTFDDGVVAASEVTGLHTVASTGNFNELENKPAPFDPATLAGVAVSGSFNDLADQPAPFDPATLSTVAVSGSFNDLSNQPTPFDPSTLATVATTGDYSDLSNVPPSTSSAFVKYATAPSVGAEGDVYYNTTTDKLFLSNGISWGSVTNKAPLVLISTLDYPLDIDTVVSKDFSEYFTDSAGDVLTYTVSGTLPTGTSFSGSTLSGTVTTVETGTFYILVTDQEGLSSAQQIVSYTISLPRIVATGGSITTNGNFKTHTFTGSGTFNVTSPGPAEILIVGGGASGGAGSHAGGGGGGAGGLVYGNSVVIVAGVYSVTVGGGGAQTPENQQKVQGNDGSNSILEGVATAYGGGGGGGGFHGTGAVNRGRSGGSSGGGGVGGSASPSPTRGVIDSAYSSIMTAYGNSGGTGADWNLGTGGGGGAGQAGTNGSSGSGGNGLQYNISGSNTYYAGGGGGGTNGSNPQGGLGGGGQGYSDGDGDNSTAGQTNTGGGGGAGGINATGQENAGGSGIVIIKYEMGV